MVKINVLIVSDRCFGGLNEDRSGPAICQILGEWYPKADIKVEICGDDYDAIKSILKKYSSLDDGCDLILTSGGTGFGKRDITPEVVRHMIEKEAYGLSIAMIIGSLKITPFAALSRPCCGIINHSLIITLPGSPKGSIENLKIIGKNVIDHALFEIQKQLPDNDNHFNQNGFGIDNSCQCNITHENDEVNSKGLIRKSKFPIIREKEALNCVLKEIEPLGPDIFVMNEYLNLGIYCDKFCYETIISNVNIPAKPTSIKDGYAIDSSIKDFIRVVIGISNPGKLFQNISASTSNSAIQVSTGSIIPEGMDAVIQVEDTEVCEKGEYGTTEKSIKLLSLPNKYQDIRAVGSDIKAGQIILQRHAEITPQACGLICSLGIEEVRVYKTPVVGVLSTGDEVKEIGTTMVQVGAVYDSNRYMLIGLLKKFGYTFVDLGIVQDDFGLIASTLTQALKSCDVIICTGGVSMGEKDYMKKVIVNSLSGTIHFGRVFVKPGMPTTFATIPAPESGRKIAMFALPGNPVSAFAMFHVFVLPALTKMSGCLEYNERLPCFKAMLGEDLILDPRPQYVRGILCWNSSKDFNKFSEKITDMLPIVRSTGKNQMSSCLASTTGANCLIKCQAKSTDQNKIDAGDVVDVIYIN